MFTFSESYIENHIADNPQVYERGKSIYEYGAYLCRESNLENGEFSYHIDGNYGDYLISIKIEGEEIIHDCDCPYSSSGCKHTVAVLLDVLEKQNELLEKQELLLSEKQGIKEERIFSELELKEQAIQERQISAKKEKYEIIYGDTFKGEHVLKTLRGREYQLVLHDPEKSKGHCSCPDFLNNRLGFCKHLIFLCEAVKSNETFQKQGKLETFPYIDIFWDSVTNSPKLFLPSSLRIEEQTRNILQEYFDGEGNFHSESIQLVWDFIVKIEGQKQIRIHSYVRRKVNDFLTTKELTLASKSVLPPLDTFLKIHPVPYQIKGIKFGLYKKGALIGDEMGLGKTLQAIAISVLKKEVFGFKKILIVTMPSHKDLWKSDIKKSCHERAIVVAGSLSKRKEIYHEGNELFKITDYESVNTDLDIIQAYNPDLVILDKAQRIKNFKTIISEKVKQIPRKHSLILTGVSLQKKLEDLYSIIQFIDDELLAPLWKFHADYFKISKDKNTAIDFKNLDFLDEKLRPLVIRRTREDVLNELPSIVENNYFVDFNERQADIHLGYSKSLISILDKKFPTPMDLKRTQELFLLMRRVCDSTYLIDRETHISPKLHELINILEELLVDEKRKVVIFSEWTSMTYLIGKHLSKEKISFVELSGQVPQSKRQGLVDEFNGNPKCQVFLATDVGGEGLDLQKSNCIINFELPNDPKKLQQRIHNVLGKEKEKASINVVNLVTKGSIEEVMLANSLSLEKRNEVIEELKKVIKLPKEKASKRMTVFDPPFESSIDILDPKQKPLQKESSQQMEDVLNKGVEFLSGLIEMSTGNKLEKIDGDEKMLSFNEETGEIVLKFKLPPFK